MSTSYREFRPGFFRSLGNKVGNFVRLKKTNCHKIFLWTVYYYFTNVKLSRITIIITHYLLLRLSCFVFSRGQAAGSSFGFDRPAPTTRRGHRYCFFSITRSCISMYLPINEKTKKNNITFNQIHCVKNYLM